MELDRVEQARLRLGLDQCGMSCGRVDAMTEEIKKIVSGGSECLLWYLHTSYLAASALGYGATSLILEMAEDMAVKESGSEKAER